MVESSETGECMKLKDILEDIALHDCCGDEALSILNIEELLNREIKIMKNPETEATILSVYIEDDDEDFGEDYTIYIDIE